MLQANPRDGICTEPQPQVDNFAIVSVACRGVREHCPQHLRQAAPQPRDTHGSPAPRSTASIFLFSAGSDPGKDDVTTNDDPVVREAALEALGREKGSVVAVDPTNGRILAIVNQKMAFSAGFEPCSTIKPFIAIAGLSEGVITRDTMIQVGRRHYMDLTEAMAHSNNNFFEAVGTQLGFDRVVKYDRMFGLGQRVGYNIPEEQPGSVPSSPPFFGGVARMSSFGASIRITPFQLASMVSLLANGGTQYYLQYPRTAGRAPEFHAARARAVRYSAADSRHSRRHAGRGALRHGQAQLRPLRRTGPGQDRHLQR